MALAPLAPIAPEFAGLLASLLVLAGCLVCLGIVFVLHGFTTATVGGLGKLLGHIPGIGGVLSSPVNAVYHWMNSVFAAAEHGLDAAFAYWLHSFATLVHWIGAELEQNARWLHLLTGVVFGSTGLSAAHRLIDWLHGRVAAVEHAAAHTIDWLGRFERSLPSRVEGVVLPRLRPLERAIGVTIPHDIAGLRARAKSITERLDNLWQKVRTHDKLLGTAALTAAVAVALARLDLNWIRCRNWNRIGKGLCGSNASFIESLLADALLVVGSLSLVQLAEEVQPIVSDGARVVQDFWRIA
jgi:hypothetical protein